ncbi:MAG TPA: hypothetical protein VFE18_19880 [Phenylobacterium sp.]|jgi:hypothetical protein|uniref:hypothetical protein n=1 Tax=Phenylobacterium sp. TaxID=1871053 RepID=UPI002D496027|nr:hypothetical protein [Phenylobacterium sp.]HZZ70436.1 hypothetical protein [Phenylobacterium sp.]
MDDDDEANSVLPTKPQAVSGGLDGIAEAINTAGEPMLEAASPVTRFILKRIPGAPALVFDAADWAKAPNKTRATVGLVGGLVGGAAGGAMGAAAGGVNAPIGAALGSAYGEKLGDQLYDEHSAFFDR